MQMWSLDPRIVILLVLLLDCSILSQAPAFGLTQLRIVSSGSNLLKDSPLSVIEYMYVTLSSLCSLTGTAPSKQSQRSKKDQKPLCNPD